MLTARDIFCNILDAFWHCEIDLIACLGGDGTLLHASSLFQVCCTNTESFCALKLLWANGFQSHIFIRNAIIMREVDVRLGNFSLVISLNLD